MVDGAVSVRLTWTNAAPLSVTDWGSSPCRSFRAQYCNVHAGTPDASDSSANVRSSSRRRLRRAMYSDFGRRVCLLMSRSSIGRPSGATCGSCDAYTSGSPTRQPCRRDRPSRRLNLSAGRAPAPRAAPHTAPAMAQTISTSPPILAAKATRSTKGWSRNRRPNVRCQDRFFAFDHGVPHIPPPNQR